MHSNPEFKDLEDNTISLEMPTVGPELGQRVMIEPKPKHAWRPVSPSDVGTVIGYNERYKCYWVNFDTITGPHRQGVQNPVLCNLSHMVPAIECECGNKANPIGQGHSHWCKRFKQEF